MTGSKCMHDHSAANFEATVVQRPRCENVEARYCGSPEGIGGGSLLACCNFCLWWIGHVILHVS